MNTIPDIIDALSVSDSEVERRLRTRLTAAAADAGLLDVAYRTVDSPVGSLLLAATDRGLVRVAFAGEGHDAVLQRLAEHISPRILRAPARLDAVARELEEYFRGNARRSTSRSTSAWPRASGGRCSPTYPRSTTARRGVTPPSRPLRAVPAPCGPSEPPARQTLCQWWCLATEWCAATAASASTWAGPQRSPCY